MSLFRYLSPVSLSTMRQMDKTIIPVAISPEPYPAHVYPEVINEKGIQHRIVSQRVIYDEVVHERKPEKKTDKKTEREMPAANTTNHRNQRRNQFRPRVGKGGAASYQLRQYAEVTLGGGSLRKVVKLPEGEDENEWLAVNSKRPGCRRLFGRATTKRLTVPVVDFYNQINLLYGAITEFCSPQSCPEMKATDEYEGIPATWRSPS